MVIALIGFMGCGKSTIGKRLSGLLATPFIDLDDFIVQESGKSIPELFAVSEEYFRQIEADCLEKAVEKHHNLVLALGGGAIINPRNAALMAEKASCVYLKASVDTLQSHLEGSHNRPLLEGYDLRTRIEDLMKKRAASYEAAANITIVTDGKTVQQIATQIYNSI